VKELDEGTIENSELVHQTFNFWFSDQEHIRSPFPAYIQGELRYLATQKFHQWAVGLHPNAKDEVNDEIIAEKFEEIIFETGLSLVKIEDEKNTITYPFLPRIGDTLYEDVESKTGESVVIDRYIYKEKDLTSLKLKLQKKENQEIWETEIELPE